MSFEQFREDFGAWLKTLGMGGFNKLKRDPWYKDIRALIESNPTSPGQRRWAIAGADYLMWRAGLSDDKKALAILETLQKHIKGDTAQYVVIDPVYRQRLMKAFTRIIEEGDAGIAGIPTTGGGLSNVGMEDQDYYGGRRKRRVGRPKRQRRRRCC